MIAERHTRPDRLAVSFFVAFIGAFIFSAQLLYAGDVNFTMTTAEADGSTSTDIQDSTGAAQIEIYSNGGAVFNEQGNSTNFTVAGSTNAKLLNTKGSNDSVNIGDTAATNSAILNLYTTLAGTKSLMLPRMTTGERGALTAANGMMIYNLTTHKFNVYQNGGWRVIDTVAGGYAC